MIPLAVVSYSETYDLHTQNGKMGLIGIHTPSTDQINSLYNGLFINHKFFRVVSCDVVLACASVLPADPLQIGVDGDKIAPQDMFNPILYRACSNDSFGLIQNKVYGIPVNETIGTSNVKGGVSVASNPFNDVGNGPGSSGVMMTDAQYERLYYGLLAMPGWKKAMPQSGLTMRGLYPIVYQVVNTFGNQIIPLSAGSLNNIPTETTSISSGTVSNTMSLDTTLATTFRGPSMRMPKLPTRTGMTTSVGMNANFNNNLSQMTALPRTYVAMLVMPPAKKNIMYYRLRVTWHIEFSEIIPMGESYLSFAEIMNIADRTYGSDYSVQSAKMDSVNSTVDAKDMEVEMIMSGA